MKISRNNIAGMNKQLLVLFEHEAIVSRNDDSSTNKLIMPSKSILGIDKYDVVEANEFGRKYTVRYKQYAYDKVPGINNWSIARQGCGPTSLATILSSFGYCFEPVDVAKMLLSDKDGELDFYIDLSQNRRGIREIGFIYFLNKLISEKICDIHYEIIKLNHENPNLKKEKVIDMIRNEYMAIICVGPFENSPKTFSNFGHYLVVTSVNNQNNEFYIANSNETGDNQIDLTFSYETIVQNMYKNSFDFLMIKDNRKSISQK